MTIRNIKIQKSEIAIIQLRKAIQLFNSSEYIPSLTLAGAANDILGELAVRRQGYNMLDFDKAFWDGMSEILRKDKPSKDKIKQLNNKIKNSVKHHDELEDSYLSADYNYEAQRHIDSAIRNYYIAFDNPFSDKIVNRYVRQYWT